MDKTGWFVVSLCVGLLGLQWYYNSTNEQPAAAAAPVAATAPADPAAAVATPVAPQVTTPAPAAPAAERRVIASLTSKNTEGKPVARYNFTNIGGGTYAKMLPNVVAFGPIFPGDEVREHKPDEYMELSRLLDNANIIAEAMYALAN